MANDLRDTIWVDRYGYVCPLQQGKIITIDGVHNKDYYNPALCALGDSKILAFRMEDRESSIITPEKYHPEIAFAAPLDDRHWRLLERPAPIAMLEDPTFLRVRRDNVAHVVLGGVRVQITDSGFIANTEFYTGPNMESLSPQPFAVIKGMKDVRLLELPDGRLLLSKRPTGGEYEAGKITLHVLDNISQLSQVDTLNLRTYAVLDSGYAADWVGTNSMYLLPDVHGDLWVGLLGHLGLRDVDDGKHYAVTTYKIRLEDLLDSKVHHIMPRVIATRACFEDGPWKTPDLGDVVFPGSLDPLGHETYRLWAGLSDARIGTVVVDNPFGLRQLEHQATQQGNHV